MELICWNFSKAVLAIRYKVACTEALLSVAKVSKVICLIELKTSSKGICEIKDILGI